MDPKKRIARNIYKQFHKSHVLEYDPEKEQFYLRRTTNFDSRHIGLPFDLKRRELTVDDGKLHIKDLRGIDYGMMIRKSIYVLDDLEIEHTEPKSNDGTSIFFE